MTPAARIQAVIDILGQLEGTHQPADRVLRDWGRTHRFAGSKDRAAIVERLYAVQRRRASFGWRMRSDAPRALVIASLLDEDGLDVLFSGTGYGPAALTEEERAAIASPPGGEPPAHVRGEYPQFLEGELHRAFGENVQDEMHAMLARAPVDLRVNTLKAARADVLEELGSLNYEAEPTRLSPFGIRVPAGASGLDRTAPFLSGAYEFQDEAAQIAALLAGARPGMRVLDLAAGAGGKALALAALMENSGEITAHDVSEARLNQIAPRAERAGVSIVRTHAGAAPPKRAFDLVFLDSPCSGSGTWRRAPENKWRLTPERLAELNALQDLLLDQAANRAARIVYATCSILPCENEDRVQAFLARHPDFAVRPARDSWAESGSGPAPMGMGEFFRAGPLADGTDGFFTAILARTA